MTNEPSPRPWRMEQNVVGWNSFIADANGDGVAACWISARGDAEKERQYDEANAALIVDAVNERDELKDASLRLAEAVIAFRDYARKIENELLHCHRDLGGEISQRLIDLVTVAASLDGPEMETEKKEGDNK